MNGEIENSDNVLDKSWESSTKETDEFLKRIPGNSTLQEIYKTVLTSTKHILWKVLAI